MHPPHTDMQVLDDHLEVILQQLCTDTGYSLEDLAGCDGWRRMTRGERERERERERVREIRTSSAKWRR